MRSTIILACFAVGVGIASSSSAQSLQESLDDGNVGGRWKYDDWASAKAAAAKSKKPILALFR